MKTKIFITRHGVTSWNKEGRMQGKRDIPLHSDAYHEVKLLAHNMREFSPFDLIYTSHLLRTIQTGQIIQDVLGIKNILHIEDIAERGYGKYEGRVFKEVLEEFQNKDVDFHRDYIKGIESPSLFKARVLDGFTYIYRRNIGKKVVVVTHGGVIAHLLDHLGVQVDKIPNSSLFLYIPEDSKVHQLH